MRRTVIPAALLLLWPTASCTHATKASSAVSTSARAADSNTLAGLRYAHDHANGLVARQNVAVLVSFFGGGSVNIAQHCWVLRDGGDGISRTVQNWALQEGGSFTSTPGVTMSATMRRQLDAVLIRLPADQPAARDEDVFFGVRSTNLSITHIWSGSWCGARDCDHIAAGGDSVPRQRAFCG